MAFVLQLMDEKWLLFLHLVRGGHVRGAVLKLPTKNGHFTNLQQPLQLLYPLEIKPSGPRPPTELDKRTEHTYDNEQPQDDTHPIRPIRQSALRTKDCLKEWSSQLLDEVAVDHPVVNPGGGCVKLVSLVVN